MEGLGSVKESEEDARECLFGSHVAVTRARPLTLPRVKEKLDVY